MGYVSLFDQETQVHKSGTFTDTLGAGSTLESGSVSLEGDLNAVRSQIRKWMYQDATGGGEKWYNDVPTVTSIGAAKKRGIYDLAVNVDALEEHRILFRAQVLTDVVVPAGVKATSNLLLNSLPLNNETVTIGTTTYTFKTALTPANWEVLIGATAADSADNLTWAINMTPGHPGTYQVPNAHPDVTAAQGAGDSVDVTAIVAGTKGNLIATSETLSDVLSVWTGATLAGGTGDIVVLSVAGLEAPTENGAIGAVTTKGAVAAYNSDFSNWKLVKVAGVTAIQPKNLCIVRDAASGEIILSGDKEVYALLATESATDNQVFNDAGNQVELVFVKENMTGTDLEQVPGTDIGGKTINYSYVRRLDFDNLPETAFLTEVFLDQAGAVDVTRQHAYDNQGATPVDILLDAILDIEVAGKKWEIRDTLEATLFKITEGAGGGTSEVAIGADVDSFNVDAAVNDFAEGVTVDSGGVDIQLGITAIANTATIGTLAGNDLRLDGARELRFDDGNQTGSTWVVETDGIKLSDTTAEWDAFRTAFGEVSLLNAIVAAQGSAARCKAVAQVITADIPANTLVEGPGGPGAANISADLCDYDGLDFTLDVDLYVNGQLQWCGANAAANKDVYPALNAAERQVGCFYAEYILKVRAGTNADVITMIVWGTPP